MTSDELKEWAQKAYAGELMVPMQVGAAVLALIAERDALEAKLAEARARDRRWQEVAFRGCGQISPPGLDNALRDSVPRFELAAAKSHEKALREALTSLATQAEQQANMPWPDKPDDGDAGPWAWRRMAELARAALAAGRKGT